MTTAHDTVTRALAARRLGVKYKLGAGGMDPAASTPADAGGSCDCSGFAMWCLALKRLTVDPFHVQRAGGWVNTDGMVADALSDGGFLDRVQDGAARAGDLLVFGKQRNREYGHVGVITQVMRGQPTRVVHCSPANRPSAIEETGPETFARFGAIVVRHRDAAAAPMQVHMGVYATEFGGGAEAGMPSAYGGLVQPAKLEVSLPARVPADRRLVVVENPANGNRARCRVNDVGPWNTADAYWDTGARPAAEAQHKGSRRAQNKRVPTNPAGIDLTPAVMDALGVAGKVNTRAALVNWWFE